MEYWHGKLTRNLQYDPPCSHQTTIGMPKLLPAETWNELQSPSPRPPPPAITKPISTGDSKNRAGSSSSQGNKAASSEGSFANVRAWQLLCHMGPPNHSTYTIPQRSSRQVVKFIQKLFDFPLSRTTRFSPMSHPPTTNNSSALITQPSTGFENSHIHETFSKAYTVTNTPLP